jgi:hypothetical protein
MRTFGDGWMHFWRVFGHDWSGEGFLGFLVALTAWNVITDLVVVAIKAVW